MSQNDFSQDPNCLAVYRFESGALTADSKGSNTLSTISAPQNDTSNYKEGSQAVYVNGNDGFYRADANLPADFPFKNGTSNLILSFAGWIRPTVIPGSGNYDEIICKHDSYNHSGSFALRLTNGNLQLVTHYGSGNYEGVTICALNTANRFYHIGLALNGTTGAWLCRVWDDAAETATTYSGTLTNTPVVVGAAYLWLFMEWYNSSGANFFNGQGDEFAIFKDYKSAEDFDQIRQGIYGSDGTQVIQPAGIASAEAFGQAALVYDQPLQAGGIASAEAFGQANLAYLQVIAPAGIPAGELDAYLLDESGASLLDEAGNPLEAEESVYRDIFGQAAVVLGGATQILETAGIASAEAFGSATVQNLLQILEPAGIPSGETFGQAAVANLLQLVQPAGIASAEAFGQAALAAQAQVLQPAGIESQEVFGGAGLKLFLRPVGIPSAETFGDHAVTPGPVSLQAAGIPSEEEFGQAHLLTPLRLTEGIASEEAFGAPKLKLILKAKGISSKAAVGNHTVIPALSIIQPKGLGSRENFGQAAVVTRNYLWLQGIDSGEAFGQAAIHTRISLQATGIASEEALGQARIVQVLKPAGIASEEAVGAAVVVLGQPRLHPQGIPSAESFGQAVMAPGSVSLQAAGIASQEAFGNATVRPVTRLRPASIASAEALGTPTVLALAVTLRPKGIPGREAFGLASLGKDVDISFDLHLAVDSRLPYQPLSRQDRR